MSMLKVDNFKIFMAIFVIILPLFNPIVFFVDNLAPLPHLALTARLGSMVLQPHQFHTFALIFHPA